MDSHHEGRSKRLGHVRALVVVDGDHVLYLNSIDYSANELVEIATSMQLAHPLDEESGWYPF